VSIWIVHAVRTISDDVPAPPDQVRDFYVDLDNIKDLHPLVVSVQLLEHHHTAGGYQKTYRVRDRIHRSAPVPPGAAERHREFPADRLGHPVDRTAEHRSAPATCRDDRT